jgi:hypothetical protein
MLAKKSEAERIFFRRLEKSLLKNSCPAGICRGRLLGFHFSPKRLITAFNLSSNSNSTLLFLHNSCCFILVTMNDRDRNYEIVNSNLNRLTESTTEVPTIVLQTSYADRDGLSQEEFVSAEMINDDVSYHVGESACIHFENNHQLQGSHLHAQVRSKEDFDNATMIHVDSTYDVTTGSSSAHVEGNHQPQIGVQTSYLQQPTLSPLDTAGGPSASVAGKKRKSETGLANVSMKTVMRWRGKEGIDIDCLLGATASSTVEERTRAEDILNATGQLLCILCAQSVSGNKKSVRRHQLKNAKHLIRLNEVANGQPFPSTDAAMTIVVPMPYVPLDLAVSTASRGCQEAWEIVKNAEKANDFPGLTANLELLGECTKQIKLISSSMYMILHIIPTSYLIGDIYLH